MSKECTLPTHPRTGLQALGFTSRGPIWPVMGGDDSDDAAAQAAAAAEAAKAAWQPPASQADLDRIVETRLARDRAKYADYEEKAEKARQFDVLSAASQTDTEKAVAAARAEAATEVRDQLIPGLVAAAIKAEAKGILSADQIAAVLEDYNPKNYLDDQGDVDEAKIAARVARFATTPQGGHVTLGQGRKPTDVKPSVGSGREAYEAGRKKRSV